MMKSASVIEENSTTGSMTGEIIDGKIWGYGRRTYVSDGKNRRKKEKRLRGGSKYGKLETISVGIDQE